MISDGPTVDRKMDIIDLACVGIGLHGLIRHDKGQYWLVWVGMGQYGMVSVGMGWYGVGIGMDWQMDW